MDVGFGGFGIPGHLNPAFRQGGKVQNRDAYVKSLNGPDLK